MRLEDGTRFVGQYEETVGSVLLFSDKLNSGDKLDSKFLCHTERRLKFQHVKSSTV